MTTKNQSFTYDEDQSSYRSSRDEIREWARHMEQTYPVALTLTLKQYVLESTDRGKYYRNIDEYDCERIANRFAMKLNRQVFGRRRADKGFLGLRYIVALEGKNSKKNLHLHLAIGGFPEGMTIEDIDKIVCKAKSYTEGLNEQHMTKQADIGWIDYITKEVRRKDTDSILWSVA